MEPWSISLQLSTSLESPSTRSSFQYSCLQYLSNLLPWIAQNQFYQSLPITRCSQDTDLCLCPVQNWLLQYSTNWLSSATHSQTSESSRQRCQTPQSDHIYLLSFTGFLLNKELNTNCFSLPSKWRSIISVRPEVLHIPSWQLCYSWLPSPSHSFIPLEILWTTGIRLSGGGQVVGGAGGVCVCVNWFSVDPIPPHRKGKIYHGKKMFWINPLLWTLQEHHTFSYSIWDWILFTWGVPHLAKCNSLNFPLLLSRFYNHRGCFTIACTVFCIPRNLQPMGQKWWNHAKMSANT